MALGIRVLPCRGDGQRPPCSDGVAKTRDGRPYWIRALPARRAVFAYTCYGCRHARAVSVAEFASLPRMTLDEARAWGLLEHFLPGLRLGGELSDAQALDLLAAGWTAEELLALPPPRSSTVAPIADVVIGK